MAAGAMTRTLFSTPLGIQRLIALPFLGLGGWCLIWPGTVERLVLLPGYQIDTLASQILMGCFGAQAVLSGLFAAFSIFTRTTFMVYGIALLPFFGFNYYFLYVEPVFTAWMFMDFGANLVMLGLCAWGWRLMAQSGAADP
jgi:hypothetical protein